jgi:hypothetical protein
MQLMDAAQRWGDHAVRAKEEAAWQQRELADFNRKVDDNYHRTNEIAEAMISFAQNITSQGAQIQSPRMPFALPCTLAHFEATRAPIQVKIKEAEEEIPLPLTINRTKERMAESAIASSTAESERARNEACEHKRAEAWKQTTSSLKEMQACATRRRQRGQSFGPPSYAQ